MVRAGICLSAVAVAIAMVSAACGGNGDSIAAKLLEEEGRSLSHDEAQSVLEAVASNVRNAHSLRQERTSPDPAMQVDGSPARIEIVRRDDGSAVARRLAELAEPGEQEQPEYEVACPGGPDAPAYTMYRAVNQEGERGEWVVSESTADHVQAGVLTTDVISSFGTVEAPTALGKRDELFGLRYESEDASTTLWVDSGGRIREAESRFSFQDESLVYTTEYDVDLRIDLPQVDQEISCPATP